MTKKTINEQDVFESPYSQEEHDEIVNKVRIEERFISDDFLGSIGVPAKNRLKVFVDAGNIIKNIVNAKVKDPVLRERWNANKSMGDIGIALQNRPKEYVEAGEIVMNMILSPPKKGDEPDPGTQ